MDNIQRTIEQACVGLSVSHVDLSIYLPSDHAQYLHCRPICAGAKLEEAG
jgi:hypothetical protein